VEKWSQRGVTICQDLLERQDDILGRVITGDETWATNTTLKRSGKVHNERLLIPLDQNIPSVQIKSQNNFADFFLI